MPQGDRAMRSPLPPRRTPSSATVEEVGENGIRRPGTDDPGDLLGAGTFHPVHRPESAQERSGPRRTHAGDLSEIAREGALRAFLAMPRDREPVSFVANPLDELQRRVATGQPERIRAPRNEDLLFLLRESRDRQIDAD